MKNFIQHWITDPTVVNLITALIFLLAIIIVARLFQKYASRHIKDPDIRYRVRKFITFLAYAVGIFALAAIFNKRLGGLHIAFGVVGAGIAFSLQEVIISTAGWFAVTFAHFYKTGDRVQLGGIKGDVIDIGVLRTTLMEIGDWVKGDLYNGRVVRVANSFVFKEPVFNYSGDFPFLWDEIAIPIRHGSDIPLAKELLQKIADDLVGDYAVQAAKAWKTMVQKYLIEDEKVEPTITMTANENWIEYAIRYVVDYRKRRRTKDQFYSRILEEIRKTEGRVAIAGTTLGIIEAPVIDVRINEKKQERMKSIQETGEIK